MRKAESCTLAQTNIREFDWFAGWTVEMDYEDGVQPQQHTHEPDDGVEIPPTRTRPPSTHRKTVHIVEEARYEAGSL